MLSELILASLAMIRRVMWHKMKCVKLIRECQAATAGQVNKYFNQNSDIFSIRFINRLEKLIKFALIAKIEKSTKFPFSIGYSRRKYRDPCRRVVSLVISMRVDKYYEKPVVWDKVFMDNNSEQFEHLSYEAMRAVSSSVIQTCIEIEILCLLTSQTFRNSKTVCASKICYF